MKKLKTKVFLVIFILLTSFTFIIFLTSTTRSYMEKKNSIMDTLTKMPKTFEFNKEPFMDRRPKEDSRRIFLDRTVYTVILDESGNYQEVVNNTNYELDEKTIKKVAKNIIKNHSDNLYIGNLYVDRYAYIFNRDNTLVIIDNTGINSELQSNLIINLFIFVLCEIVIFIITSLITKWIITPVKKSFEKQKIFVADASHELKTPLAVMTASADAYFNDKDEKWVYNMKNESERMIKLVTELLDLAKTEQDVQLSQNNLSSIVESSILTFESLFYENKIKLKYNIEKNINMMCNENLIVELISILVDNAIRHCSKKKKVVVNLVRKNKQIVLEVKNTGLPIKKEDEEKIFERFYKVDASRNRNSNNYGLGLAIAKNIVERHNGTITAHSDTEYTTFKIVWNQK